MLPVLQRGTRQGVVYSDLLIPQFAPTADVAVADIAWYPIPELSPGVEWPLWQIAATFTAGVAKTAELTIWTRDEATGTAHALALMNLVDGAAVTDSLGQVQQFEAAFGMDMVGMSVTLGGATDRPVVLLRGLAYIDVPQVA